MKETIKQDKSKREEFLDLLEADMSVRKLVEGTIIEAKVTHIGHKFITVDVMGKSESQIACEEFFGSKELEQLKIGSTVSVMLESMENRFGQIQCSRESAKRLLSWNRLLAAFEQKKDVLGIAVGSVRGGLAIDVEGSLAFLPMSQIALTPRRNFDDLYKTPTKFKPI